MQRIGTSGYSFLDWLGTFYPTRTKNREMFGYYVQRFETVEINFSFYRMPTASTFERLGKVSPDGFDFWIKACGQITHEGDATCVPAFLDSLRPLQERGKLAGVLLQFPQSYHRTVANRTFLARVAEAMEGQRIAVEFRHRTWQHASVVKSMRERGLILVVPDVPEIRNLYHVAPTVTGRVGYLRLHSRNADNWYDGGVDRYDYNYTEEELRQLADEWAELEDEADQVYTFFNNCHSGQAAQNAEAYRRLLKQIQ